ncbi:MAG: flavodoxin family protein [Oscillospiraceae bacterium]|jgi:multimeric flavodoxin WrbA|nr:flavodoxin family protein [Oscillospiraceae bacterium]
MPRKTLIINGSPRAHGDTAALIAELSRHLDGDIAELSAFRANIAPCIDCRACRTVRGCVFDDDMRMVYADDFDALVIASPVYFSNLPGALLSLASRLQPWHNAKYYLGEPIMPRPKLGGLIFVGGGSGNESGAQRAVRPIFRLLNAAGFEDHTVLSMHTDTLPAAEDRAALDGARELAYRLNSAS